MSLEVKDLSFSYGAAPVLRDVSFSAHPGELLSVLGPNGVGKSTLFRCILGLLTPQTGTVTVDEADIRTLSRGQLARRIAYIPQSHAPVFNFSVFDVALMGTTAQQRGFAAPGRAQNHLVEETLERLGIAHLRDRGYANISGGERQLVLIARALVQQARILVMDEPSASLDYGNRHRVMETVRSLTAEGYTVLQSTHDPDQAYLYSHRILALHDGGVLACGKPSDILCGDLISTLYGVEVEVCSLRDDTVRVCVPRDQV